MNRFICTVCGKLSYSTATMETMISNECPYTGCNGTVVPAKEIGKCRGCGAAVVWIKTSSGKSMPCDPSPVPYWATPKAKGKVITQNGAVISCEFEGDPQNATGLGYISHFSTCPQAVQFKKKK